MNKFDMADYVNHPDYGESPDCSECGSTMMYSYILSKFKCPECGYEIEEDDVTFEEADIPAGCISCGGPYPACKTSCKLFDD